MVDIYPHVVNRPEKWVKSKVVGGYELQNSFIMHYKTTEITVFNKYLIVHKSMWNDFDIPEVKDIPDDGKLKTYLSLDKAMALM